MMRIMKRSFSILLTLLVFGSSYVGLRSEAAENYIRNGSFEEIASGSPADWIMYNYAASRPTAEGVGENVLINGQFESFNNNQAIGWTYYNASKMQRSTAIKHDGDSALEILGSSGGSSYVYQSVTVTPSVPYMFSGWVYLDSNEGTGIVISLIFYTADGISCGKRSYDSSIPALREWHEITITAPVPENAASMMLYAYMQNPSGKCYYDDFAFYPVEEEAYAFKTDEIFYYADNENGTASVVGKNASATAAVDFSLSFAGEVIEEKKNVSLASGKAEYVFQLSRLSELKKEYVLTATIKEAGAEVKRFEKAIYKYPRPSKMTKEGLYMDGDSVFDPVIAYHVYGDDYKRVSEVGINVVEVSAVPSTIVATLDELQRYNLKALIALCNGPAWMKPAAYPGNIANTRAIIDAAKDHPALFGYYAMDEPFVRQDTEMMKQWMEDSYRLIHETDDVHPIYTCEAYDFELGSQYADILACEPYPYSPDSAKVTGQTAWAVSKVKSGKPVYTIVQTWKSGILPTAEQVRGQVYRAFESGAKGIGYYSFSDAFNGTSLYNNTEAWDGMKAMAQNELPILFDCFVHKAYTDFSGSDNSSEIYSLFHKSWVNESGDTLYLVAHNRSTARKTWSIPLQSYNGAQTVGSFTAQKIGGDSISGNGTLSVTLDAGQTSLYRITPANAINVSLLSNGNNMQLFFAESREEMAAFATSNAQDGERYVSLAVKDAGIMQKVDALMPDASYSLSLWYRGSVSEALKLEIQFYRHDENGFLPWETYCENLSAEYNKEEKSYIEYFGTAEVDGGNWREIRFDFYTPQYSNALTLSLSSYKKDRFIEIDNIALEKCEELNLVKNGSFDSLKNESKLSGGWFAYDEYMQYYKNVLLTDGYIQMSEGIQSANARQFVYLKKGQVYSLSFRYKNDYAYEPHIGLFVTAVDGNNVRTWGREPKTGTWDNYTLYFTAKSTAKYTLWIGDKVAQGQYRFDDVVLQPVLPEKAGAYKTVGATEGAGAAEFVCSTPVTLAQSVGYFDVVLIGAYVKKRNMWIALYQENTKKELRDILDLPRTEVYAAWAVKLPLSGFGRGTALTANVFSWNGESINTLKKESVVR